MSKKKYHLTLHQQAYDRLKSMQAFGESKKEAIVNGTAKDKIFAYNTFNTYWKHTKYFVKYLNEKHPEVKTLKKARRYVNEWLQYRTDYVDTNGNHLSAWTIQTEAKALSKLFGIDPTDVDYFEPPKRRRSDIKRSRVDTERDRHFSKTNNDELIKFCQGTGLRRDELKNLRGKDLFSRETIESYIDKYKKKACLTSREEKAFEIMKDTLFFDSNYFIHIKGKGGRERLAPIIGPNEEQIVERIKKTADEKKVWQYVNSNADIHSYRSDYATAIYKTHARKIEDIPYDRINKGSNMRYQSDVYVCRCDERGKKLDRRAMLISSKALGHNRVSVVAENYLRGI